ncbi:MAG: DUF1907 domain-containing protein [Chloroflexota bacterium]
MLTIKKADLWIPDLDDLVPVIQTGLETNYDSVSVEVVTCPDLRTLGCATPALSGSPALVEVGGEPYAHNPKYRDFDFDTAEIAERCNHPQAAILGAALIPSE